MTRTRLGNRRSAETFQVNFIDPGTQKPAPFIVTLGPQASEVFVCGTGNTKPGSVQDATLRDAAVIVSIARQYGVPLDEMQRALTREPSGAPSSPIGAVLDAIGGAA